MCTVQCKCCFFLFNFASIGKNCAYREIPYICESHGEWNDALDVE